MTFGRGFKESAEVRVERLTLVEVMDAWRGHTGPLAAHLAALRQIASQVAASPGPLLQLRVFPAHAEALIALVGMAETSVLAGCPGATRRERRSKADPSQRRQLRRLSVLRKQMQRLVFTLSSGAPFCLGGIDGPGGQDTLPDAVFAVIDCETSGFSPAKGDAMLELAIVLADAHGDILAEWETLLNPCGPVGAEWVHGITAEMVSGAPTFAQVTDEVGKHLASRVIVAHNASFDLRFLRDVAQRYVRPEQPWEPPVLCTQQLAREFFPHGVRKLADCCAHAGISLTDAHTALADARATTRLLKYYIQESGLSWAAEIQRAEEIPPWPVSEVAQRPTVPRPRRNID
ncbi:PolC-type DNA polymerase III [Actinomadura syzygii]|uniref:3'-5' exonuclease n=1 Tax=Actinomadura syzygii TaxID=1427538 RepID=A0A5D0TN76_9ACTN|nr:3'-5' exonuclease [Actinomadura syzygii]TYC07568.1 3'-5' exonuclease [Actinomadura syzygii]